MEYEVAGESCMVHRYFFIICIFFIIGSFFVIGCDRYDTNYTSIISQDEVSTITVSCYKFLGVPSMCVVTDETTTTIRVETVVTNIVDRIVKKEVVTEVLVEKIVIRVEKRYIETGQKVDIEQIVKYILDRIKENVKPGDLLDIPTDVIVDETVDHILNPPPPNKDKESTTMGDVRNDEVIPTQPPEEKKEETSDPNSEDVPTEDGSNNVPEDGSNNVPEDGSNNVPEDGANNVLEDGSNNPGTEGGPPTDTNPNSDVNGGANNELPEEQETPWRPPEGVPTDRLQVNIGPRAMQSQPTISYPGLNVWVSCQIDDDIVHPSLDSFSVFKSDIGNMWGVGVWCLVPSDLEDTATTVHVVVKDFARWCGLTPDDITVSRFRENPDGSTVGGDIVATSINLSPNPVPICSNPPVFTEGADTTRTVAENTPPGVDIGAPVSATDVDGDTLTYSLSGIDGASFSIDSTSGQLKTSAALNYEIKNIYSVLTIANDNKGGIDEITVTINVTDENDAPVFIEGSDTTRSIVENTNSDVDIGAAVSATDEDGDTLIYTLSGIDGTSFSIDSTSGQLKTSTALDYETKTNYSVLITANDNQGGTDEITVTINVTDENDAPVFTEGSDTTRSIAENTNSGVDIGTAVSATDEDGDTLIYTLSGIDGTSFSIDSTSGQLKTMTALNYENKDNYSVLVTASDNKSGTDEIQVTITITDANDAPVFTEESPINRSIVENSEANVNVGEPVTATDEDGDTLVYSLRLLEVGSFSITGTTGQLLTSAPLDYETKSLYWGSITAKDGNGGTTTTTIRIGITNGNDAPMFVEGETTKRAIIESAASGSNVGHAVSATDEDDDTLEYTLSGTDASSFSIDSNTGQLSTAITLDYDTKSSYSLTVSVSDEEGGSDEISVTVEVLEFYIPKQEFFEVYYAIYLNYGFLEVQTYTIRGYGYDDDTPIYVDNYYKFEDGSSHQTSTGWGSITQEGTIAEDFDHWKDQYPEADDYVHANTKVSVHDRTADEARILIYKTICNAARDIGTWSNHERGITYPEILNNTSDDILDIEKIAEYLDDDDCDPDN